MDDDPHLCQTLSDILEEEGYKITTCCRAREVLNLVRRKSFNGVLVELKMADMDGISLLREIKKLKPNIWVIIITAYSSLESAIEALNQGADAFLSKPLNINEVKLVIEKALEKQFLIMENWRLLQEAQREITERKQAEEVLRKYHERLEERVKERTKELKEAQEKLIQSEKMALLGQLLSGIGHELKNPLGVIDSSIYYLKNKFKDMDDKVLLYLNHIKEQVKLSNIIIQSLQNLARMKKTKMVRIDIARAIEEGIAAAKLPSSIKVDKKVSKGKFFVDADKEQLTMVFKNLSINAMKEMDKKGSLWATAAKTKKEWIEVSFKDSGPGIAPENLRKIFQPFFSSKEKGLGLGLAFCQMIIEKHGGTIKAQSKVGEGATFIIRLPSV